MASGRALAQDAGLSVLEARGAARERDFAFGVARQLFEQPVAAAGVEERQALLAGAAGLSGRLVGSAGPEGVAQGADTASGRCIASTGRPSTSLTVVAVIRWTTPTGRPVDEAVLGYLRVG